MADFTMRTTTEAVTRHEWRLATPSKWVELDKMLVSVKKHAEQTSQVWDDSYDVELDDEVIVIVFTERRPDTGRDTR